MICGIILAAGESSRMGRPKALLPASPRGETFLERLAGALREGGIQEVVVVLGAAAADIRPVADRLVPAVRVVVNERYAEGQLSSLLAGLAVVDRPGVLAAMIAPVDVPLVAPETVRALVAAYERGGVVVVRPVREGRHGHPVIVDRRLFDELRHADPAQGARAVIRGHAAEAADVPVADDGVFTDIDTPADYERSIGMRL